MTLSSHTTSRWMIRLVALILSLGVLHNAWAKTPPSKPKTPQKASTKASVYPKQKLTAQIAYWQIISDLAAYRGLYPQAYEGYTRLAKETSDARFAKRALAIAQYSGQSEWIEQATQLLARLDPKFTAPSNTPSTPNQPKLTAADQRLLDIIDLYDNGQTTAAFDQAQDFVRQYPKSKSGWAVLAEFAHHLKQDEDTIRAYEQLLKLEPNNPEHMNNLGYLLVERGIQLDRAQILIHKALKRAPNAPHILDSAAWLAYRQNRLDAAVQLAEQAMSRSEGQNEIALHLAELYWVTHNQEGAIEILKQLKHTIKTFDSADLSEKDKAYLLDLEQQISQLTQRLGIDLGDSF